MRGDAGDEIVRAVRVLEERETPLLLAVSGGVDSMTLLDAAARVALPRRVAVATFDHGTGPWARAASALVVGEGERRGFRVHTGRASLPGASEAEWRSARWQFLRNLAEEQDATVVTAHTLDDQVETVVMRMFRGSGVRGLAGLNAAADVARPLLGCSRDAVARYARRHAVRFVEDPSNASRVHLRNRIRHDVLPALRRVQPEFEREVLELAERAADVRRRLDDCVEQLVVARGPGGVEFNATGLSSLSDDALRLVWQSIAASADFVLDWRGTVRLAGFARSARIGSRAPLSGGGEVVRRRDRFVVRHAPSPRCLDAIAMGRKATIHYGDWHFSRLRRTTIKSLPADPWMAALPSGVELVVRAWQPGDRLLVDSHGRERRVKRYFSDARIVGPLRDGWPVVLAGGKVVWIPGLRRTLAPVDGAERHFVIFRCERHTT